eukprot:UN25074
MQREDLKERNERYREEGRGDDLVPNPEELRPIDVWFGEKFYKHVHLFRMPYIAAFVVVFCLFLYNAAQLKPDPDPPNIYPSGYNYGVFWDKYSENFKRQAGDNNVIAWTTFGLIRNGIDRDGTDPTDVEDLGDPTYSFEKYPDHDFDFWNEESMEFITAICEDMQTGERYGDKAERMVYDTDAVVCMILEFRDWVWSEDPESMYNMETQVNPATGTYIDENLKACLIAEEAYKDTDQCADDPDDDSCQFHQGGNWPIKGFWNNFQRFIDWAVDDYEANDGRQNIEVYSDQLYATRDSWTKYAEDCPDYTFNATPAFWYASTRLTAENDLAHTDGMDLYEFWEEWIDKWLEGESGVSDSYIPSTTHCDKSSLQGAENSADCDAKSGCSYDSGVCSPSAVTYPGAVPKTIKDSYVTDERYFSYYYLQATLLSETYSGIALSLTFAFVILNIATANYVMACVATAVITQIVIMILGFTVIMGWKLGILESIIYVMVVGMSVDYVVHLGESYLESAEEVNHDVLHDPDSRHFRAKMMLEIRGFSVLSGAISTLGGIFFLFFAFIIFFVKFAYVIFFLIFCSLMYSLVFFTACMDTFGPEGTFGEWHLVWEDFKLVWAGEMACGTCCHNCIVPPSKHNDTEEEGATQCEFMTMIKEHCCVEENHFEEKQKQRKAKSEMLAKSPSTEKRKKYKRTKSRLVTSPRPEKQQASV